MKKLFLLATPLLAAAIALPAQAEQDPGFYLGLKTGNMDFDISSIDADTPMGVLLGYQFNSFAVELEGSNTDINIDGSFFGGDTDFTSVALYGVYRTDGQFYFKAKAGIARNEIGSISDTGLAGGIGGGINFDQVSVEAEYTVLDSDVNFISIGLNVYF